MENQAYVIGLDVGGTKIAGGVVALPSGEVLLKRRSPTRPERGGEAVLATTLEMVQTLMQEAKTRSWKISGIGLGVAELVVLQGNVTSSHTIAWTGMPVQSRLAELAPCIVESDVRAAALAEAICGAGQSFQQFVYVTVGTGISHSLVLDGRPFLGARGNGLTFASSPMTAICPACGATSHVVLENFASGPALVARYNQLSGGQYIHGEEVIAAAAKGDAQAIEVVETAGEALGVGVGWLVNVLDPQAVIIGGGLGLAGGLYWNRFIASTRYHIYANNSRDLPILQAALDVDAGLIGAAATIWRRCEEAK
jgi:glucokinase